MLQPVPNATTYIRTNYEARQASVSFRVTKDTDGSLCSC